MTSSEKTYGPYAAVRVLATGATSVIWLANGPEGEVALKVARSPASHAALLHEAEILRRCEHPNILKLLGAAPDGEWLATERAQGSLLDQWASTQDFEAMTHVASGVCAALAHLHAAGIVHGDVKPANILVGDDGRPLLVDLGIAVLAAEERRGFRGTLGFVAPEVLRGETPGPAADLYGLGATLYACIADRPPFVAPDPAALTYLPLVSLPAPPSAFRPEVPAGLNRLVLALLARDPKRRPSLADVRDQLGTALDGRPVPPVVGMAEEREELRRAIVGAADGEPRVVVVYGPPGSGRRTLISEAVEAARREGLPYVKATDPKAVLPQIKQAGGGAVAVLRGGLQAARKVAQQILDEGTPALLLLHSERPIPTLDSKGVVQITPTPLDNREVARVARVWGADASRADQWCQESLGLPIAVVGRIRAWKRAQTNAPFDPAVLPSESRKVLEALTRHRSASVVALATELNFPEAALLDHCEVLFAEGVIRCSEDGATLRVVDP
jgi:predicted Ser/Thr protein kinase